MTEHADLVDAEPTENPSYGQPLRAVTGRGMFQQIRDTLV